MDAMQDADPVRVRERAHVALLYAAPVTTAGLATVETETATEYLAALLYSPFIPATADLAAGMDYAERHMSDQLDSDRLATCTELARRVEAAIAAAVFADRMN